MNLHDVIPAAIGPFYWAGPARHSEADEALGRRNGTMWCECHTCRRNTDFSDLRHYFLTRNHHGSVCPDCMVDRHPSPPP